MMQVARARVARLSRALRRLMGRAAEVKETARAKRYDVVARHASLVEEELKILSRLAGILSEEELEEKLYLLSMEVEWLSTAT
ncbi:hypothetical protein [Stetteria hydrogenophila]